MDIKERNDISRILQEKLKTEDDLAKVEQEILSMGGPRQFIARLGTGKEQCDLRTHFRRYLKMFMRDCSFGIATTDRYCPGSPEACIIARRNIRKGEKLLSLCGKLITLTLDQEKDFRRVGRDFSIILSSRNYKRYLFLGPARFVNHDCDANATLERTGSDHAIIGAVRNIENGEEITIFYGDPYFGTDNKECGCRTCGGSDRDGAD